MRGDRERRSTQAVAAAVVLGCLVAGVLDDAAAQVGRGRYSVGAVVLDQRDESRQYRPPENPWGGDVAVSGPRPIQTLVWYPARGDSGGSRVLFEDYAYLWGSDETLLPPDRQVRARVRERVATYARVGQGILAQHLGAEMGARWDAPAEGGRFPLIVYAPGWGQPSWMNSQLCEMLASHGYVVVASPSFSSDSRQMVDGFAGLDAQARDIEFLARTMQGRPDVLPGRLGIVGYSWGGTANVLAAQRLRDVAAVVSIDGFINLGYTRLRGMSDLFAAETMGVPFMSVTPPPARTSAQLLAARLDTSFVFYETLRLADAYDLTFTRMRNHEDVVSVYTRFLGERADRTPEEREAAGRSFGLMSEYVLRFLNAYVRGDQESLTWLWRAPEQNGVPPGYLQIRRKRGSR